MSDQVFNQYPVTLYLRSHALTTEAAWIVLSVIGYLITTNGPRELDVDVIKDESDLMAQVSLVWI